MKKFFLILTALMCFSPSLALADAGGSGVGVIDNGTAIGCQNFKCHCTVPYPNGIIGTYQTGIDGSPPDITSVTTAEDCSDACLVLYNSVSPTGVGITSTFTCDQTTTPVQVVETNDPIFPRLNTILPGLGYKIVDDGSLFGKVVWEGAETQIVNGFVQSSILGSYINAWYTYLLGAASVIAVTMLMIAGLQYATARGDSKQIDQAKKRIGNAVAGVILLLLAYNIAFLINPATTTFNSLSFPNVAEQQLDKTLAGPEGLASVYNASGDWSNLSEPYRTAVERGKQYGQCTIPELLASPVASGSLPNQGKYHWYNDGDNYDYTKINALDWAAPWGSEILAPFSGTVTYAQQTDISNKCGNRIYLSGSGAFITICHVKDFLNGEGVYAPGQVTQGQVIGHVGGECCANYTSPKGWVTQCDASGTACTDPKTGGSCNCQSPEQSGNTTGPHVHITMSKGSSNLLACLK